MIAQQLVNGLMLGSVYALIGIGYTLVFGVLRMLNLAHAYLFMAAPFVALSLGAAGVHPAFALAGGLGAFAVALAVQGIGPAVLERFVGGTPQAGAAAEVLALAERYGLGALLLLALLPWPPRTAVLVCAVAGLSPVGIGLAVGVGRVLPCAALALGGTRASHLLRRWRAADRLLTELRNP